MNDKAKPVAVKRGSVTVFIYHTPGRKNYSGWTVSYYEPDGERKRVFRATLESAKIEAEKVATRLSNSASAVARLSEPEAAEAVRAREFAARMGRPVDLVVQEHADLVARLEGRGTLLNAVEFYLQHHRENLIACTIKDGIADFLKAREQDGCGDRQRQTLKNRLERFAADVQGTFTDLNARLLDKWLCDTQAKEKWAGRTRNHYRAALSNLVGFAKRRGYLPRDWEEMEFVPVVTEEDEEIGIYTPEDLAKMLKAEPDRDLLPFIVLGAFAGVRPSEILRLEWEDFHFSSKELFIGKGKVRTAGHRIAPLLPACARWLQGIRQDSGSLTRLKDFSHPLQSLLRRAGVAPVHDGLRHSYISYRRAITKNLPQVSSETGTDPGTLTRRYCRPVRLADAKAWFSVLPS
jgi:integrase